MLAALCMVRKWCAGAIKEHRSRLSQNLCRFSEDGQMWRHHDALNDGSITVSAGRGPYNWTATAVMIGTQPIRRSRLLPDGSSRKMQDACFVICRCFVTQRCRRHDYNRVLKSDDAPPIKVRSAH